MGGKGEKEKKMPFLGFMSVIPATLEADIRKMTVQGQSR
jgi:hypothetical protein